MGKDQITRSPTRRIMQIVNRYYKPPKDKRSGVVGYASTGQSSGETFPYTLVEGPHIDIGIVGLTVTVGVKQPLLAGFDAGKQTFTDFAIHAGAVDPGSPVDGQLFWNTSEQVLKIYSTAASAWILLVGTADVKKTDYYCYHGLNAAGSIIILGAAWTTIVYTVLPGQPDVPRSISIEVVPDPFQTCIGNVEINGINADGAIINEDFDINVLYPAIQTEETVRAFRLVTNVNITGASGTGTITVSIEDRIGVSNISLNTTTDIFALNLNGVNVPVTSYTINATYGTIDMDDVANIQTGDNLEIWCRPNK